MVLELYEFDDTIIIKLGRWTSLTFLKYIHMQIANLGKGIAKKMAQDLPFLNIACIDLPLTPTTTKRPSS